LLIEGDFIAGIEFARTGASEAGDVNINVALARTANEAEAFFPD
jgi:hypothetical protein